MVVQWWTVAVQVWIVRGGDSDAAGVVVGIVCGGAGVVVGYQVWRCRCGVITLPGPAVCLCGDW